MPLYRVTLFQEFAGQQCLNRWYYQSVGTPAAVLGSFACLGALGFIPGVTPIGGNMFDALQSLQSTGVTYSEAVAENLYDPTDFYVLPFVNGENGNNTGENLSPFIGVGFRTSRVRRDIRRGQKRFTGVADTLVGLEGELTASAKTVANNLGSLMSDTLGYDDEGNTINFVPTILSLEPYTTPSGNTAYRPYATLAEQLDHIAQGFIWEVYDFLRSQTSRQYGRGR